MISLGPIQKAKLRSYQANARCRERGFKVAVI